MSLHDTGDDPVGAAQAAFVRSRVPVPRRARVTVEGDTETGVVFAVYQLDDRGTAVRRVGSAGDLDALSLILELLEEH